MTLRLRECDGLKNIELGNQQPRPDEGKVQRLCGASAPCGEDLLGDYDIV